MIVYQGSKEEFTNDVQTNCIADKIIDLFTQKLGRVVAKTEINSWSNSMMYMSNVLADQAIPNDSMISVEFQIPLTSKRVDFIISGQDDTGHDNVIIVELKQWQTAKLTEMDGLVRTRFQKGEADTAHPSYQAWSYSALLYGFSETVVQDKIMIKPCAYLHNYEPDDIITHEFYQEYIVKAPLFLKPDTLKLREFIKRYVRCGDRNNILYRIDHGRIRPSKHLADSLSGMLKGNVEFVMIDDQKVVYERAMALAQKSSATNKNVLIVDGGPGTGKSVVSVNLLVNLTGKGMLCQYITKNAAPRAVYASKLTGSIRKTEYNNLFRGSGGFYDVEDNTFDALIVDEAHRLNLKSGLYRNLGENQIKEIINASKFSVFFVDDHQQIHIDDIGDKRSIEIWAEEQGASVEMLKLESQFRCNGSDGYLAWLDNTLDIQDTANNVLDTEEFDFRIYDDPNELRRVIEEKNQISNKARMVAGYCWDWRSKKDPSITDVIIPEFNFEMTWNLTKDGGSWLIAPNSINEIGCIHTCQGLELDYVGVIVGTDLRYENGSIVTDVTMRSRQDQSVRGIKKMFREDKIRAVETADRIIKNTYRVLLTRGMKGCYVYFMDRTVADFVKSRLHNAKNG